MALEGCHGARVPSSAADRRTSHPGDPTASKPSLLTFGAPLPRHDDLAPDHAPTFPAWLRRGALGVAILRYTMSIVGVALIPFLIRDHLVVLITVRPTKELLLLGGGQTRVLGEPPIALLFAAYIPLMVMAVWAFFIVGRAYRTSLRSGAGPRWLRRVLPPGRLEHAQRVLARRGPTIAVIGRVAAIPPTVMAAAAGTSNVSARRYIAADITGAVTAFATTVGAGYILGQAYEEGGIWLSALGLVLFATLIYLLTRWIREETDPAAEDPEQSGTSSPDPA